MERGQESVYSNRVKAGRRRTYFFDVRKTKGDDFYITLTESTRKFNGEGYSRHKIFLYKEDFNRFVEGLQDAVSHVKNELMPDYDYEQFDRRQEEWERQAAEAKAAEEAAGEGSSTETSDTEESSDAEETPDIETASEPEAETIHDGETTEEAVDDEGEESSSGEIESEEDMDW